MNIGDYIKNILSQRGIKQSSFAREIHIPRQALSYVILGEREITVQLALKIESALGLPEGQLLKIQVEESVKKYKRTIKENLFKKLEDNNALWSYSGVTDNTITDELLIEKVFEVLDMPDISYLFELYPCSFIKKVWRENMASQGDYLFNLNVMIAQYYFHISNPESYLRSQEVKNINKVTNYEKRTDR